MATPPREPDIAAAHTTPEVVSELGEDVSGAGQHSPESADPVLNTDGTHTYTDLVSQVQSTGPSLTGTDQNREEHWVDDLIEAIAEISTDILPTVMVDGKLDECSICKEPFLPHESVKRLPCSHEYHATCMFNWLKTDHYTCPICRREVPDFASSSGPENQLSSGDGVYHYYTPPPFPMVTQLREHNPSGSNSVQDLSDAHPIGGAPEHRQHPAEFANADPQLDVSGTDTQITSLDQELVDNQNSDQNQGPEKESEATSSDSSIPHREDTA